MRITFSNAYCDRSVHCNWMLNFDWACRKRAEVARLRRLSCSSGIAATLKVDASAWIRNLRCFASPQTGSPKFVTSCVSLFRCLNSSWSRSSYPAWVLLFSCFNNCWITVSNLSYYQSKVSFFRYFSSSTLLPCMPCWLLNVRFFGDLFNLFFFGLYAVHKRGQFLVAFSIIIKT